MKKREMRRMERRTEVKRKEKETERRVTFKSK